MQPTLHAFHFRQHARDDAAPPSSEQQCDYTSSMTTDGPPKKQIELRPGERIIDAAIRELASDPDSPMSLKIMSAVSHAVAPRQRAADQVVDALEGQLLQSGKVQQEAVEAAILYWEREFKESMPSGMLGDLEHEARERTRIRSRQPPRMDSILTSYPATTDTGYDLGVHLEGLKGTWHRLWAMLSLAQSFGEDVTQHEGVAEVRRQFQQQLGREVSSQEWQDLVAHAAHHAATVMKPLDAESDGGGLE